MRLYPPVALACATLALVCGTAVSAAADDGPPASFTISDPRIKESSGLAASRLHPGVYWTHNDSGDGPYVYAIDSATGKTVARVTLRGVEVRDAEGISTGPDGSLYLGDIGDNLNGSWPEVWIYRFSEPRRLVDQTVDVTRYTVRYEGGPRNAEALMVHPTTGRVYIASKNEDGGRLYAGPARLTTKAANIFRPVADVPWVTDGAFSPDGTRLVLRGYFWASDYRWNGGRPQKIGSLDLPMQRQGESVTFSADGSAVMYGSEGGDSEVRRERLTGDDLPDKAATTPKPDPTAADSSAKDRDSSSAGGRVLGFALLAAMGAVGVGLRKGLRRRRS